MEIPLTEGIKYTGSKLKLLPHILEIIKLLENVTKVLDGFSGSTRVSQAFAKSGFNTISNDISDWSEVFATCFLLAYKSDKYYTELIEHLNSMKGIDGWFSEYYGGNEEDTKKPFQLKNTRKLDAIRNEIDRLDLSFEDKSVLLTSLIFALDKVDNTLGHYAAYLSGWSKRSYNNMILRLPTRCGNNQKHQVIRDDIFNTIKNSSYDLVYFDPPYGSNNEKMPPSRVRYAAYYHLWTTIIRNDKPAVFGKAFRREDSRDELSGSVFEEFRKNDSGEFIAMDALRKLIIQTDTRYLLLSYSSGGRATREQLLDILSENGNLLEIRQINYQKNVMSQMRSTKEWINSDGVHNEYLFLLKK